MMFIFKQTPHILNGAIPNILISLMLLIIEKWASVSIYLQHFWLSSKTEKGKLTGETSRLMVDDL